LKLLKALEEAGYLTPTNVQVLAHYAQKWGVTSYEALLQTHVMAEHSVADAIAEVFKLDRLYSFDATDVELDALSLLAYVDAQEHQCFVPNRDEDGTLQACILNPLDERVMAFLNRSLQRYRLVILDKRLMARSIEEAYPLELQIPTVLGLS
jgi:hypothetical protein